MALTPKEKEIIVAFGKHAGLKIRLSGLFFGIGFAFMPGLATFAAIKVIAEKRSEFMNDAWNSLLDEISGDAD